LYVGEQLLNVLQSIAGAAVTNVTMTNNTNISIRNGLLFNGPEYLLITCAELPNVKANGVIKEYFYKINLTCKLGDDVYDTFANTPIFYNDPIEHVNQLTIDIYTPEGVYYDFNDRDHSFVLEIVTYDPVPLGTVIRQQ